MIVVKEEYIDKNLDDVQGLLNDFNNLNHLPQDQLKFMQKQAELFFEENDSKNFLLKCISNRLKKYEK